MKFKGFQLDLLETELAFYLFKVNNINNTPTCEIWLTIKLTIEAVERRQWFTSCVFIVNFEQIIPFLVILILILNE